MCAMKKKIFGNFTTTKKKKSMTFGISFINYISVTTDFLFKVLLIHITNH